MIHLLWGAPILFALRADTVKIQPVRRDRKPSLALEFFDDIIEFRYFFQFHDGRTLGTNDMMMVMMLEFFTVMLVAFVQRIMMEPVSTVYLTDEPDLLEDCQCPVYGNETYLRMYLRDRFVELLWRHMS